VIYLDGIPPPPEHEGFWDPATLAAHIATLLPRLRHQALEMRDDGCTQEDWEYLLDLNRAIALRAWDETEKGEG